MATLPPPLSSTSNNIFNISTSNTITTNIGGFNPADTTHASIDSSDKPITVLMTKNIKRVFEPSEFSDKYYNILSTKTDPFIKTENIKLCTASIIKTLQEYFNETDPDDTTSLNEFMDAIKTENIELQNYITKLIKIEHKRNNPELEMEEIDNLINEDTNQDNVVTDTLAEQLASVRETQAYEDMKMKLDELISKRNQEISGVFSNPSQSQLDTIFNTQIQGNSPVADISSNDISINNSPKNKTDWKEVSDFMKKCNISSNVVSLLTNLNDFREELNNTHQKFVGLKKTVDEFNKLVTNQIQWIESVPSGINGDIIRQSIESNLKSKFDTEDVIELFKNYKETYHKMMLLITFAPREFISKNTCNICLSNEKNIVFVPCGHTCCGDCSQNISSCMICRTKVEKKQKIFM